MGTATRVSQEHLIDLVAAALGAQGMEQGNARAVATVVVAAERDGSVTHGLFRISGYVATLRSGHVDGRARPRVIDAAPGLVRVDAQNGFAQPAIAAGRGLLTTKARANGIATMAIFNSHHFAALWPDVEPFAEDGLIALTFANSRMRIAPWDATRRLIGTNPMAFACPRADGPPLVWDQASSVVAQGQVLLAAKEGRALTEGMLLDVQGQPTTDPGELQKGGALRAYGGHKGSAIAVMVEILAGALTGARFGFEDTLSEARGSATQNVGQLILAIDPSRFGEHSLAARTGELLAHLHDGGVSRFPGDQRHATRAANRDGIPVEEAMLQELRSLAGGGAA
jgi:delta1-piperideine-2-carboxylate reductase